MTRLFYVPSRALRFILLILSGFATSILSKGLSFLTVSAQRHTA